jgi:hypothetical protein
MAPPAAEIVDAHVQHHRLVRSTTFIGSTAGW